MITWDWVIGAVIILFIVLTLIARITGQTIGGIFTEIKEALVGMKEGGEEQFVHFYD